RTDLGSDRTDLGSDRTDLYLEIDRKISRLSQRPRKEVLWPIIIELCTIEPQTVQGLAQRLNRDISRVKQNYINPMRQKGLLDYLYPEVINHPQQAYVTTELGKQWLEKQGHAQ
ncbi:MAG: ATP-dependent DNA helicase RecG, partial [Methyloprofundus sp.]|nr:ATP-dependent DNA helicase RecG [Methyloprofundus sp.]